MWMMQIFLLFSLQFFSFVYRHSDLEGSCWIGTKEGMWISLVLTGRSGSQDLTKFYWLHWWRWLWKLKFVCCNNNKIKGNEELMLIILNRILLHNFSGCNKYVYSMQLWIYTEISVLTQLLTDFMNLSNRIFLFIKCNLWVVLNLFRKFSWVTRT
jgi:hypothetical protein